MFLHTRLSFLIAGYIFLYTLLVRGFAPPTPSINHFNVSNEVSINLNFNNSKVKDAILQADIYESEEEEETDELIINNI